MSAGNHWTDIRIRQQEIAGLPYCVQQYFSAGKEQRAYYSTCSVVAGFVLDVHCPLQRCCL
jgi:hypothetical protein